MKLTDSARKRFKRDVNAKLNKLKNLHRWSDWSLDIFKNTLVACRLNQMQNWRKICLIGMCVQFIYTSIKTDILPIWQSHQYSGFSLLRWLFITSYRLLHWKLKTQNHLLYKPLKMFPLVLCPKMPNPGIMM